MSSLMDFVLWRCIKLFLANGTGDRLALLPGIRYAFYRYGRWRCFTPRRRWVDCFFKMFLLGNVRRGSVVPLDRKHTSRLSTGRQNHTPAKNAKGPSALLLYLQGMCGWCISGKNAFPVQHAQTSFPIRPIWRHTSADTILKKVLLIPDRSKLLPVV